MATVTGDFSIDFSEVADANPYSNPDFIPLQSSQARVVSGVLRSVDGSTPAIFMLDPDVYVPGSVITAKIEVSDVGGGFDALTCGVVDEDGNGYRIYVNTWGVGRWRIDEWTPHNDSGEGDFFTPNNGDTFEVEYNKETGSLVVRRNGSPLTLLALTNSTHADKNLAPYFGAEPGDNGAGGIISFAADGVESASGSPPVISSATPSGSIGTTNTATVGCTTDTEEGTLYAVLSETNSVSTATGSQIKAGQNSTSAAADFADDAAVADSTPEVAFSGLDPETTYYYALVQETTEGFSNVLSGSFTTAAAPITAAYIRERLVDKEGDPVVSETGITMIVYHTVPTEASPNPYEVIEDVETDSSGDIDVEISLGDLEDGDPVWIALVKDGTPPQGTFKKVVPVYE